MYKEEENSRDVLEIADMAFQKKCWIIIVTGLEIPLPWFIPPFNFEASSLTENDSISSCKRNCVTRPKRIITCKITMVSMLMDIN